MTIDTAGLYRFARTMVGSVQNNVESRRERDSLNAMPTTLSIGDKDINHLIAVGQQLWKSDERFQDLMSEIAH